GQCFGLIGSNGAGKTTTMRILATLIAPTSGRVTIAGHDVVTDYLTVRRMIGYMPEAFAVFRELTVDEFLDYTAAAYGFRGDEKRQRVDGVIELTDLSTKRTSSCDALSRGMKQRLLLARALVHDPRVLILDEPTAGLDPAARVEFRQIMRGLTAAGKTIIISSHILPELAEFCTSVGIMERGRVVASGSIAEMLSTIRGPRAILVEVAGDGQFAGSILRAQPGVDAARVDGSHIVVSYTGRREELPALLRALVSAGVAVASFSERQSSLEDIFMKVAAFEVG
ncbi:MAG TPA: ABC transporter ATP-binding protein, partial [Vicinamibacterales bacterium]|nr:ABC transporter ATP-binding protein [Vicinamibacterales bacterium]